MSILLGFLLNKHLPRGGARPIDVQRAQATGIERREEARRLRQEQDLDDEAIAQILGVQPETVSQELTGVLPPELVPPTAGGLSPLAELLAEAELDPTNEALAGLAAEQLDATRLKGFQNEFFTEDNRIEQQIQTQKATALARAAKAQREQETEFERSIRNLERHGAPPHVIEELKIHRVAKQALSANQGPNFSVTIPTENGDMVWSSGEAAVAGTTNQVLNRIQANAEALSHLDNILNIMDADPGLAGLVGRAKRTATSIREVFRDFTPETRNAIKEYNHALGNSLLADPLSLKPEVRDKIDFFLGDPDMIGQLDAFEFMTATALARAQAGTTRVALGMVQEFMGQVSTTKNIGARQNIARIRTIRDKAQRLQDSLMKRLGNTPKSKLIAEDVVEAIRGARPGTTLTPRGPSRSAQPTAPTQPRRFRFEEDPNRQPDIIVDPGTGAIRDR